MIVVGGVSELYQGDLDLGRRAVARLGPELAGRSDVTVEDLYYGPVAVAQRLEELHPSSLVLVGATQRGRAPGSVTTRAWSPSMTAGPEALHAAIGDAVVGYVGVDLLLEVASALGALPADVVVVEVEPASTACSDALSAAAAAALGLALDAVRVAVAERVAPGTAGP